MTNETYEIKVRINYNPDDSKWARKFTHMSFVDSFEKLTKYIETILETTDHEILIVKKKGDVVK